MNGTLWPSLPVEWYEAEYAALKRRTQSLVDHVNVNLAWCEWYDIQRVMHRAPGSLAGENLQGTFNRARDGFIREQLVLKETYERYIIAKLTG